MAQLIVRDLEDDLKTRLRERARTRGHSMEEEARRILRGALLQPSPSPAGGLGARIAARFRGIGLETDEPLPELRGETVRSAGLTPADASRDDRPRRRR
jgi:plasmid stability protein